VSKAWRVAVLVVALAASGVAGTAGSFAGATQNEKSPKELPPGGVRKILRDPKTHSAVKVVVYGSSGEVKDPSLGTPHPGNHFIAIKFGFRNMAAPVYTSRPAQTASISNNKGEMFAARPTGRGLTKIKLAKDETAYGRVFFELRDGTKVRSVTFRPFGQERPAATFTFRPASADTSKTLPPGGVRKTLHGGAGQVIRAVFYGVSVRIHEGDLGRSARPGTHFVAVVLGLRNMGTGRYTAKPVAVASIENSRGAVSPAVHIEGRDLGPVALGPNQSAYGRIFFELRDGAKVRSFRFRPFGPSGSLTVFTVGR
jgi:hypothetical protein